MKLLTIAALALALAACASQTTNTASDSSRKLEEKEFRTGSRIPVRDGATSSSPTEVSSPSAMNPAAPPKM